MAQQTETERRVWWHFIKCMRDYRLVNDGDKVLIALSGGKDSLLLTELMARKSRIFMPRFSVEAVHVRMENVSYESDTTYLETFCHNLGIPLHIITSRFEPDPQRNSHCVKSPCFLCSWQRRKEIFRLAQSEGFNKIALGHHQDDLIHTALMNTIYEGRFDTMDIILPLDKMPLTIIRPLALVRESDITVLAKEKGYVKQTKTCQYDDTTRRAAVSRIYQEIETINPEARHSIWQALRKNKKY